MGKGVKGRCKGAKVLRFKGEKMQRSKGAQVLIVQKCKGAKVLSCKGEKGQRFKDTKGKGAKVQS